VNGLAATLRDLLDLPAVPVLTPEEALTRTGGTAVVVLEDWSPALTEELSDHAWRSDLVLVPLRCDGSTVLVGPTLHRGAVVCLGCSEVERLATLGRRTPRAEPGIAIGGLVAPALAGLVAEVVAGIVTKSVTAVASGTWPGTGRAGTVVAVRSHDGSCATHRCRTRGGGCLRCGPLPDDAPELAQFRPASARPDPGSLRLPNPDATTERLRAVLHDWRFGPVAHVSRGERVTPAIAAAEVVADWVDRDGGYGRATTYGEAERIALFEAVERLTGMNPRGRRTVLSASFAELGPDRALDVRTLGRHEPHHMTNPLFTLTPYADDVPTMWVHGWSAARDAPLAVPEHAVYWGGSATRSSTRREPGRFVAESSNGCGLGGSLPEAVLYALFEIAERDAFLMAWYSRCRLQPVAVPEDDPLVVHQLDRLDALGYDLLLFDTTNDLGVPAVMSLAVCRDEGSPAPQAFFAGGAHHDPRRAIASAVAETTVNVVQSTTVAAGNPAYFDRERLRPMLARPDLVATIDEHVGLATIPEARSRHRHLLDAAAAPGGSRAWHDVWPAPAPVPDLAALVNATVRRFVTAGVDVVVVDQTDPVLAGELGLHAAKVLAPGSIPMTFGEVFRRTRGLPRLLDVPWRLGRVDARPDYEDLPFDPHPFP
jgi:ribosomal protein S12 methylthiotransferase accessory factor